MADDDAFVSDMVVLPISTAGFVGTLILAPWSFGTKAVIVAFVVVVPAVIGAVSACISIRGRDWGGEP